MAEMMRLIDWRPLRQGKLLGFATVELPVVGLRVHDVPVLQGRGGPWACVPTKPEVDRDGRQRRDVDGTPRYARVLSWTTRRYEQAFSARIVALVKARYPSDLADVA